ncbi:uncharacterized protein IL334_004741 [Kwoniella shivajii]|uniref:Uncharacterized protein n=1 Tax=Kwoniella shivajii TaxID=564305 RepID=A0ABZ1D1T2_9TREE|nr:hypothetical protein IL334_004741 [Kwoniella shivajii]
MAGSNDAGPSKTPAVTSAQAQTRKVIPVQPAKIAKNTRLPATMVTSSGTIQPSSKKSNKQITKKKRIKSEKGKERAVELSEKLGNKVKEREEKKAKRQRAKKAWE